jgi:uncharacterized membrane protein
MAMARRKNIFAIAAVLMVALTAIAPLVAAVPTIPKHNGLPEFQGSGGGTQPSYQSGSGSDLDMYLYFHKTTTSGAQYVLNTVGGSSGGDVFPSTKSVTFKLQDPLTKNLKVFGHEVDTTHKGFWLDLQVYSAPPAQVTIEILDNDYVVANKTQLVTGSQTRWSIPFVGGADYYTFLKGDKIGVRITAATTTVTYRAGDKLYILCDPTTLSGDTYNSLGVKTKNFYPYDVLDNRDVIVKGKIDDVWGATDVSSVIVTISSPSGSVLSNATANIEGLNYTYNWNYSTGLTPGPYQAKVTAIDQQAHSFNISIPFSMMAAGVRLDSPQAQESGIIQGAAEKGGCMDYTLSVLNKGGATTNFALSQASQDISGWTLSLTPSQTGNINPGESKIVSAKVCADDSVEEGTYSTFYVQAQATSDPSAKDTIQIMTTASPKINLVLKWDDAEGCNNLVNTGGSAQCGFTVQNTGLQTLNVTLKLTTEKGAPDWTVKVVPSSIMNTRLQLTSMSSVQGTLNMTAPKDPSKQNKSIVDIEASVTDIPQPLTKSITATTIMSTGINVEIIGDQRINIDSDKTAQFFVLVSNTDPNTAHTITMTTSQPSGWTVDFVASNKVFALNPQESQTLTLKITPVANAAAGVSNIDITGKYQDNQNTWDKVTLQVNINEKHSLALTVTPVSTTVGANAGATFTVSIQNNGNTQESSAQLQVIKKSGDLKAEVEIDDNVTSIKSVTIPKGSTKTFKVTITPASDARHKDSATYEITIISSADKKITSSKTVTVKLEKNTTELFMETMKDWQMWILIILTLVVVVFYAMVVRR